MTSPSPLLTTQKSPPRPGTNPLILYTKITLTSFVIVASHVWVTSSVLAQGRFDPLTDGLVGWWQLDESAWTQDCTTTDITDSSGNRNHGKSCPGATGPAGGVTGKFNNGADLDGNDDYLLINAHSSLDLVNNGDYTISAWIYPTWSDEAEDATIVQQADGEGLGRPVLFIDLTDNNCPAQNEFASLLAGANTCLGVSATAKVWTQITLVVTENGPTDNLQFYINGGPQGAGTQDTETNHQANWIIGADKTGQNRFQGVIDDVRIYNRALTPSEVRDLYDWEPLARTATASPQPDIKSETSQTGISRSIIDFIRGLVQRIGLHITD